MAIILYRLLEFLDGEKEIFHHKFKILKYKTAQRLKIKLLNLIK